MGTTSQLRKRTGRQLVFPYSSRLQCIELTSIKTSPTDLKSFILRNSLSRRDHLIMHPLLIMHAFEQVHIAPGVNFQNFLFNYEYFPPQFTSMNSHEFFYFFMTNFKICCKVYTFPVGSFRASSALLLEFSLQNILLHQIQKQQNDF